MDSLVLQLCQEKGNLHVRGIWGRTNLPQLGVEKYRELQCFPQESQHTLVLQGNIQHLAEIRSKGTAQQIFQYLLLSSLAMLTHQVNKADFYDLKCEWHVSRPQKKVSKGKILKKNMLTCDCIQALIPEVDGYQNDSRNSDSSKYGLKYLCWTSRQSCKSRQEKQQKN